MVYHLFWKLQQLTLKETENIWLNGCAVFDYFRVCEYNGIDLEITKDGKDCIREYVEEKEWQKEDNVIFRLRNTVAAAIYEKMVSSQSKQMEINEEFISRMFEGMEEKLETKRKIGFCAGGFENE